MAPRCSLLLLLLVAASSGGGVGGAVQPAAAAAPRGPFVCTVLGTVCDALGDLYYATNGANWPRHAGWRDASEGVPTDYCSFGNAKCRSTDGMLTQLSAPALARDGTTR